MAEEQGVQDEDLEKLTIVIHLPQDLGDISALLKILGARWPDARYSSGFIEVQPNGPRTRIGTKLNDG